MKNFTPIKDCPVCGGAKDKRCRETSEGLILCMTLTERVEGVPGYVYRKRSKDGNWGIWAPDSDQAEGDEWRQRLALREIQNQQERQRRADSLSPEERDRLSRRVLSHLSLHPDDRADLCRRGLTDEQIERAGYKSVEQWQQLAALFPSVLPGVTLRGRSLNVPQAGYLCPIRNVDGLIVGFQVRSRDAGQDGRKYYWLTSATKNRPNGPTPHLQNGELPLAVFRPQRVNGEAIAIVEGTGPKPFITSERTGFITIGAGGSNWASSPQTLQETVEALSAEFGTRRIVFYPDAGMTDSRHGTVRRQYKRLWDHLARLGYFVEVAWWGQTDYATHPDIDELEDLGTISFISPDAYLRMAEGDRGQAVSLLTAEQKEEAKQRWAEESRRILDKLSNLSIEPDQQLNQRYLSGIELPEPGTILFISSPCDTGKTTLQKSFINTHRKQYPDGHRILEGYRNGLLRQTGRKTGIPHIQDIDAAGRKSSWRGTGNNVATAPEIALCTDSLLRRPLDSIAPHTLYVNDECDAINKHSLEGGTLRERQQEILTHKKAFINRVLETGGIVVCMEDGLGDLPIQFMRELTGDRFPIKVIVNDHQAASWQVRIGSGRQSGFISEILENLRNGKRVIVPSTSQEFGERLEDVVMQSQPDKKIIRLDGHTSEEAWAKQLMDDPDTYLAREKPDLFIHTPTAESGVDITIPGFDLVMGYLVTMETRAQYQMLSRYRVPVPRVIFTKEFSAYDDAQSLRPDVVLAEWQKSARYTATITQLESTLSSDENGQECLEKLKGRDRAEEQFWNKWIAFYGARISGSMARMEENLIRKLEERGHCVEQLPFAISKAVSELWKASKQQVEDRRVAEWVEASTEGMTPEIANLILSSSDSTRSDRLSAQKYLKSYQLPGADLDNPEFVRKVIVQDRGRFLRETMLLWLTDHPDIAAHLDVQTYRAQLGKPFVIYRRLSHNRAKVETLALTGIKQLASGIEYQEADPVVQQIKENALKQKREIRRYLKLNVNEDQTAIAICNKLLKRLGFSPDVIRKEGPRGQQIRIWAVADAACDHREAIFKAFEQRFEKWLKPNNDEGSDPGSHDFTELKPLTEIVTTVEPDWSLCPPDVLEIMQESWAEAEDEAQRRAVLDAVADYGRAIA